MKLLHISMARIPSEKANTYQVLQMCDALAGQGVDITLVHPARINTPGMRQVQDVHSYYELRHVFPIVSLPTLDLLWPSQKWLGFFPWFLSALQRRLLFPLLVASYNRSLLRYLRDQTADLYYLRAWRIVSALVQARPDLIPDLIYEAHTFPEARTDQQKIQAFLPQVKVVAITQHLKTLYTKAGVPPEKILVAPDGVDLHRFSDLLEKQEARQLLGLPEEVVLICYTGHLYPWKGTETLARSITYLPPEYRICIVGGMPDDIASLNALVQRENLSRVELVGYTSPSQVPHYMAAADILALPNSGLYDIGRHHTSPLKLFEYMAATRPIVASDLPSVREVLNEHNAVLVRPDDPQALAEGIRWVLEHPQMAQSRARQAYEDVQQYTWEKRARQILAWFTTINQGLG